MKTLMFTSKNRVTIPAEIVRQLKLGKSRKLIIGLKGDKIILKPYRPGAKT